MKPLSETELKAIHDRCEEATNARTDIPALLNHIEYLRHENYVISKQQNVAYYVRAKELLEGMQDLAAQAYRAITMWDQQTAQWVGVPQQVSVDLARLHLGTILKTLEAYTDNWRERALKAEALTQWQPIETAPKDGTRVLVTGSRYLPVAAFYGVYHPNAKGKPEWRVCPSGHRLDPTHWQPLPQPPEVTP